MPCPGTEPVDSQAASAIGPRGTGPEMSFVALQLELVIRLGCSTGRGPAVAETRLATTATEPRTAENHTVPRLTAPRPDHQLACKGHTRPQCDMTRPPTRREREPTPATVVFE